MSERKIIVVDTETTGLDPARHTVVEVAWVDLATGAEGVFVPPHNPREVLAVAEFEALRVNRYIDRLVDAAQDSPEGAYAWELAAQLGGNTLAGANPAFDAAFLTGMFTVQYSAFFAPRWHHRLFDLSAYAAGVLGLDPTGLPDLSTVCGLVGVVNAAPHTALGDARATAECFRRLMTIDPATRPAFRTEGDVQ